MKKLTYIREASFVRNGLTFVKDETYEVTDDEFKYLMADYKDWFTAVEVKVEVKAETKPKAEPKK